MSAPQIREAAASDARPIAVLLEQLGHPTEPETVTARLTRLQDTQSSRVFVAEQAGETLGVIGLHWFPLMHRATLLGRITVLVVREDARGQGIGRLLVEKAVGVFQELGCGAVEVTSNVRRTDAHAFYHKMGFDSPSRYFRQRL